MEILYTKRGCRYCIQGEIGGIVKRRVWRYCIQGEDDDIVYKERMEVLDISKLLFNSVNLEIFLR